MLIGPLVIHEMIVFVSTGRSHRTEGLCMYVFFVFYFCVYVHHCSCNISGDDPDGFIIHINNIKIEPRHVISNNVAF